MREKIYKYIGFMNKEVKGLFNTLFCVILAIPNFGCHVIFFFHFMPDNLFLMLLYCFLALFCYPLIVFTTPLLFAFFGFVFSQILYDMPILHSFLLAFPPIIFIFMINFITYIKDNKKK